MPTLSQCVRGERIQHDWYGRVWKRSLFQTLLCKVERGELWKARQAPFWGDVTVGVLCVPVVCVVWRVWRLGRVVWEQGVEEVLRGRANGSRAPDQLGGGLL